MTIPQYGDALPFLGIQQFDDAIRALLLESVRVPTGVVLPFHCPNLEKHMLHGTTIGALMLENGNALLGFSDGKVSFSGEAIDTSFLKIRTIDSHTCLLLSGSAGLGVRFARALKHWVAYLEDAVQEPLSARAKVGFLQELAMSSLALAAQGFVVNPILVTYDYADKKRARIFMVGPEGTVLEKSDCMVLGSGYTSGASLLEEDWEVGLGLDDGLRKARKVLRKTTKKDNASGGNFRFVHISATGMTVWEEEHNAEH